MAYHLTRTTHSRVAADLKLLNDQQAAIEKVIAEQTKEITEEIDTWESKLGGVVHEIERLRTLLAEQERLAAEYRAVIAARQAVITVRLFVLFRIVFFLCVCVALCCLCECDRGFPDLVVCLSVCLFAVHRRSVRDTLRPLSASMPTAHTSSQNKSG